MTASGRVPKTVSTFSIARILATNAVCILTARMRDTEKLILVVALLVPLLVATLGCHVRYFVGTWHLVRGPGGWMLDQPDLRPAPDRPLRPIRSGRGG